MKQYNGYLFLMFDIPSKTKNDKKHYSKFKKILKVKGFIMVQESIYYKYYDNLNNIIYDISFFRREAKTTDQISAIKLTENDFNNIIKIQGDSIQKLSDFVVEY